MIELRTVNAPPVCLFSLADRIVQEQCCVTVLEDNVCTIGINTAKEQGVCHSLLTVLTNTCESKTKKVRLSVHVHTYISLCLISIHKITLLDGQLENN